MRFATIPDMPEDSLNVDLADVNDIRAKMSQADRILRQKARTAIDSVEDYQSFRELVTYLAKRAGSAPPRDDLAGVTAPRLDGNASSQESGPTVLDLVVGVVKRDSRMIRPRDVRDILEGEGHTFESPDSVSNALNYAARRDLVRVVERGWYAPLSFRPQTEEQRRLENEGGEP
jgi:hypothetical protein